MTIDEHGRPEPPLQADELGTLIGFLDFHRATLAWKVAGLDAPGLAMTVGPTSMSLGGMLKHLAYVEDNWFDFRLHGRDRRPPWDERAADRDRAWDSAADDAPEELRARWEESVERSRTLLRQALDEGGLDRLAKRPFPDGRVPSTRSA